jgi:hypothetical protein
VLMEKDLKESSIQNPHSQQPSTVLNPAQCLGESRVLLSFSVSDLYLILQTSKGPLQGSLVSVELFQWPWTSRWIRAWEEHTKWGIEVRMESAHHVMWHLALKRKQIGL